MSDSLDLAFGRGPRSLNKSKEQFMDQNNRVLSRLGARELSEHEVEVVSGSLKIRRTFTPCFVDNKQQVLAGDQAIGEC
jgi:hypothetical protein